MKYSLNQSIQLTKQQRRGPVILLVPLGLFIIILSQGIFSFFYSNQVTNPGWLEILDNLSTSGAIIITLMYCRLVEKRSPSSLGFTTKNSLKNYLLGLLLGFILIIFTVLIIIFTNSASLSFNNGQIKWWFILFSFFGYMSQGLMEETVCRGFIMNSIASRYGIWPGIIANSLIFSSLHHANEGFTLLAGLNIFLIGVFFSLLFYYTDSLLFVGAVHTVWNFTTGPFLGIQVSGLATYSSILKTIEVNSQQIINGGVFGLEAGLAVTLVMVVVTTFLLYKINHNQIKKS